MDKYETAKNFFGITKTPTVVVYKDGKEVKKSDGMDEAGMQEIAQLVSS